MSIVSRLKTNKKTILIVDDDEFVVHYVETIVKSLGYAVQSAENGVEGLACATKYKPSCIFLDLSMPELDGFGFLKHRARLPGIDTIPVIVLSSNHTQGDVRTALDLGACGYLVKPIDAAKLTARLMKVVPSPFYSTPESTTATWEQDDSDSGGHLRL